MMPLMHMILSVFLSIYFLFLNQTSSQELSFGSCPKFPTVKNFDINRYLGLWYEYSNYFAIFQAFQDCVTAFYTDETPSSSYSGRQPAPKIGVLNRGRNVFLRKSSSAKGTATLNDPNDPNRPGELIVNFGGFQPESTSTNYNVVDTDYENFAVVYSCNNKLFFKSEILWILTRKQFPSPYLIKDIKKRIRHYGLDTRRLKRTNQKGCPRIHWISYDQTMIFYFNQCDKESIITLSYI